MEKKNEICILPIKYKVIHFYYVGGEISDYWMLIVITQHS